MKKFNKISNIKMNLQFINKFNIHTRDVARANSEAPPSVHASCSFSKSFGIADLWKAPIFMGANRLIYFLNYLQMKSLMMIANMQEYTDLKTSNECVQ